MTSEWKIQERDGVIEAESATLTFGVMPDAGGTIVEPVWRQCPDLWTPDRLWTRPFIGTHYDRWSLNQLIGCLMQTAPEPLRHTVDGDWLEIAGLFLANDIRMQHKIRANAATGEILIEDSVEKTGPGPTNLQLVHESQYSLNESLDGPQGAMILPVGGGIQTLWALEPSGAEVLDQNGHSVHRARVLSAPWIRVAQAESKHVLLHEELDTMACFAVREHRSKGTLLLNTYTPDFELTSEASVTKSVRLCIEPTPDGKPIAAPAILDPDRRGRIEAEAAELRRQLDATEPTESGSTAIRRNLIAWKLQESDVYMRYSDYAEAENMLADARRAFKAIADNEPAELPQPGEVLYESSFREFPLDWQLYGFCHTENDPEKGFHLQPVMTTNMWTREEFDGDYVVEIEFCPTSEHKKGGTFLQMCGRCVNPRDDFDFMASAMGRMAYYNFGIPCYHYSFNRGNLSVCNFRKTGKAFYVLAQIEEPVRDRGRWYRHHFVKNDAQFLFFVDGRLALEYFDEGNQGDVYPSGRIGIRNWARQSSWFRNLRIYRPAE